MKLLSKDEHCRGRESKPGPTEYETELLGTQQGGSCPFILNKELQFLTMW
jgi:hypothetical protein